MSEYELSRLGTCVYLYEIIFPDPEIMLPGFSCMKGSSTFPASTLDFGDIPIEVLVVPLATLMLSIDYLRFYSSVLK
jgi:hypothetical protein